MVKYKDDKIIIITFIVALLFLAVSLLINTSKSCDVNIDYDVVVDTNTTGIIPNVAQIKLACYKLCVNELKGRDNMQKNCFDKCDGL
jgi:hypothetical protein